MAFLLVVFAGLAAVKGELTSTVVVRSLLGSVFYAMNVFEMQGIAVDPMLGHLWSLALEEQFYLVWPVILIVVLRGRRRLALSLLGVLLAIAVAEGFVFTGWRLGVGPDTRSVGLLIGCATALVRHEPFVRRLGRWAWPLGLAGLAVTVWGLLPLPGGLLLPGVGVSAALLLLGALEGTPLRLALSLPPVTWIGRISYSVYLWHVPLIVFLTLGPAATRLQQFSGLVLILAFSSGSYYLIERPFRRASSVRQPRSTAAVSSAVRIGNGRLSTSVGRPAWVASLSGVVRDFVERRRRERPRSSPRTATRAPPQPQRPRCRRDE